MKVEIRQIGRLRIEAEDLVEAFKLGMFAGELTQRFVVNVIINDFEEGTVIVDFDLKEKNVNPEERTTK